MAVELGTVGKECLPLPPGFPEFLQTSGVPHIGTQKMIFPLSLIISIVLCAASKPSSPSAASSLVNDTDCLMRSFFLEYAEKVNPNVNSQRLSEMADSLSGDPLMGSGCIVSLPSLLKGPQATTEAPAAAYSSQFFVDAYKGNDSSDGSIAAPFLSIERAIAAIRSAGPGGGIVQLRGGGIFNLSATLALGPGDSGLTIQTYPGDDSIAWISGATPLINASWAPVNISGGANVWSTVIPPSPALGADPFASLRLGDSRLIRARYPNAIPETGTAFSGHTTSAASWTPTTPLAPSYGWEANTSLYYRNNSACSNYYMNVNGTSCDLYTPSLSHFCGGAVPSGMVLTDAQAPHQPYANPAGALITAVHGGLWCSFQYTVGAYAYTGGGANASGSFTFSGGGQQCGRPEENHDALVIENVLEELDWPSEYYWNASTGLLTYWHNATAGTPPPSDGTIAIPHLMQLITAFGTQAAPVTGLSFIRVGFRDAAPAILQPHMAPSGGDWAVNRLAALTLGGVENITIGNCSFWRLDNAGIFLGGYARGVIIRDSEFAWLGESGVISVGDTDSGVCSDPSCGEGSPVIPLWGPEGLQGNQPRGTQLLHNYAHELGIINLQSAFYFQAVTDGSLVQGNIVYNGARSGTNFNDAFGSGSTFTENVMWNLNRVTADHGLFNAWDRLFFMPGKDAQHRDVLSMNLLLANYNSFSSLDTDDCSAYFDMKNNVQLYGHSLKSDFSGHDITWEGDLSIFGGGANQYQPLVPGYFNYMTNCTLLSSTDGSILINDICPNATDFPRMNDIKLYSPTGLVTVCGIPLATWQAEYPTILVNITAAPFPSTLTAAGIVQMARDTLGI